MTGSPFSPPTAFKIVQRDRVGKHEKTHLMHGKCHKCTKWVTIEGIKDVPSKVSLPSPRLAILEGADHYLKVPEIHW